jgi:hypothetical protein
MAVDFPEMPQQVRGHVPEGIVPPRTHIDDHSGKVQFVGFQKGKMQPANVRLDWNWFERWPVFIGFKPFPHFFWRNSQYAI